MAHVTRTLAALRHDRRGISFLELVSTAAVLGGIMLVAGSTFERELQTIYSSVRASIISLTR
ncbi:MAG: hypothetical protein NT133_24485 [Alphaproteobacteria bacterium]|nr:hypothetical protein [Alphaproteobacteria bacterium]